MPIIGSAAPLPARPTRILVAGTSGSGKTTLARRIAAALDLEHVEIDALFHGPGWTPRATFEQEVDAFSTRDGWVTEWQYSVVRPRLAARADLMVWLDLPIRTVMRQVTGRTLLRWVRREELWNGNLEPPPWRFLTDDEHVVRWAWRTRHHTARRIEQLLVDHRDLPIVRLRTHAEAATWVAGPLSAGAADG